MKFGHMQAKVTNLSLFNKVLILLSGGMLLTNLIMVGLFYWVEIHKEVIVIPAVVNQPFAISDTSVDGAYLEQMALFFTYLRFNVNPNNIDMQQHILEQYLAPEVEGEIQDLLADEDNAVKANKISSQFYLNGITVDPDALTVEVSGTLNKTVGNLNLAPQNKDYLLKFSYHYGRLQLTDFEEIANANS